MLMGKMSARPDRAEQNPFFQLSYFTAVRAHGGFGMSLGL